MTMDCVLDVVVKCPPMHSDVNDQQSRLFRFGVCFMSGKSNFVFCHDHDIELK